MQKADHVITGMLAGLILPAMVWFFVADKLTGVPYLGKPGVPYLLPMLFNLLLIRFLYKKDRQATANGIMIATFLFMLAVFLIKLKH